MSHIVVGISGGVDSSVAAALLKDQGYDVEGIFMKNWDEDDIYGECTAEEDFRDATSVCKSLDIPLHGVNFSSEYWEKVFMYFIDEYASGRTPNPDILCNKEVKFKVFLEYALARGATHIATGHYARVEEKNGKYFLLKGRDNSKDQTYFLYTLGQEQLSKTLFPLGDIEKKQVRQLAHQYHLVTENKKDSTGICFIGERNFREFLSRYLPAHPGEMHTPEGEYIGLHQGLMYYTLGQRQGLGIGGRKDSNGEPWFVVGKNLDTNVLIVAQGKDHPLLYQQYVEANKLHWVSGEAPTTPYYCKAKTRYRQQEKSCCIKSIHDGIAYIEFEHPQWAVTPGQSIVFYQDEVCLGGGTIEQAE